MAATALLRIEPIGKRLQLGLRELWEYRDLIYFLTWRDVKVRYKQTALGAAWAVLQPLLTMILFTIIFGRLARVPSDGVPYPIFAFAGLVPWLLFANGMQQASASLVGSANLITKVYFPRLSIPTASVAAGLVDFSVAFGMLAILMVVNHIHVTVRVLALPAFVLLALAASLGTGMWFSALNVRYRDIRYMLTFLTQFWLFATPIAYPSSLIHQPWQTLYGLNPMAGVVEGSRWALLGTKAPAPGMFIVSFAMGAVLLISGLYYFRKMESTFADVV
jgi:lipopolysaccharide transport system permease protein